MLNNADWLLQLRYIEFLRDIGRHFSVNEMLAAETYQQRLETTGLNFVEFNYRLVQAYDFLHLYRTEGCTLQMGGSDQWGNIVAGVDLIRRVERRQGVRPRLPAADDRLRPEDGQDRGQLGLARPGADLALRLLPVLDQRRRRRRRALLRLYTFLPESRIRELTAEGGATLREAKRVLAQEVTTLAHGEEATLQAEAAARALFRQRV